MFLFSGTFFPLSALPLPVQYFAIAFLPLTHIVNGIRLIGYGTLEPVLLFDLAWIIVVCAVLLLVSINMMKKRLIV
jgi:lipooligosaccharide transport system permease protein